MENVVLVQLVDATTSENGGASDMELARLFETRSFQKLNPPRPEKLLQADPARPIQDDPTD